MALWSADSNFAGIKVEVPYGIKTQKKKTKKVRSFIFFFFPTQTRIHILYKITN